MNSVVFPSQVQLCNAYQPAFYSITPPQRSFHISGNTEVWCVKSGRYPVRDAHIMHQIGEYVSVRHRIWWAEISRMEMERNQEVIMELNGIYPATSKDGG